MKPKLRNVLLYFYFLSNLTFAKTEHSPHPYGEAKKFISLNRQGDQTELIGNITIIDEIFLHPEVKDRKIVVFSIIGAYREGKSFFLDYCLRYLYATYSSVRTKNLSIEKPVMWMGDPNEPLSGFSWKHGSKADTKGALLWSDVFLHDAANGDKIAIILMDTQGLFEPHSPDEENAKIFSFSTLMSSIQIINIKDTIKENQITHLQSAIDLTKLITNKQKLTTWKPFQNLLFLIRDFDDEDYEYGYGGGQKYFDSFFSLSSQIKTRSNVNRKSIRQSFDSISCFLLNYPGEKIRKKQFNGQWGLLDKTFVENLKNLIESLLKPGELVKKSVFDKEVTSYEFRELITGYMAAYGTLEFPDVESLYDTIISTQMKLIVNQHLKKYQEAMKANINYDREDFIEWTIKKHEIEKGLAVRGFVGAKKFEDEQIQKKFEIILNDKIESFYRDWSASAIRVYNAFKAENEIRIITALELKNSQLKLGENVNFEDEKFEDTINKKINDLSHLMIKRFVDNIKKYNNTVNIQKFIDEFARQLRESQSVWRDSVINTFHEIKLKDLLNSKLEEHRQAANDLKDYNQDDFEKYFFESYKKLKNKVIQEFQNMSKVYGGSENLKEILASKIDSQYDILKSSKLKDYLEFTKLKQENERVELDSLIHKLVSSYHRDMNTNVNFNVPDFQDYANKRHNILSKNVLDNFIQSNKFLKYQDEYKKILEDELWKLFKTWQNEKTIQYEKYQEAKSEQIEKDMANRIESFALKYEREMSKDLPLYVENFESLIDEKHKRVKEEIVNEFDLDVPDENPKYKDKLLQFIADIFADLKEKKVRENEELVRLEQTNIDNEIEIAIEKIIYTYKVIMNEDIDYTRSDFFEWFKQKHIKTVEKLVNDFKNDVKLQKSLKNSKYEEDLEGKLNEEYENEKGLKSGPYKRFQEEKQKNIEASLKQITNDKIFLYAQGLQNIDYNHDDFPKYILQIHDESKMKAIAEFDKALSPELKPRSQPYKTYVLNWIDQNFERWKKTALEAHQKYLADLRARNQNDIVNFMYKKVSQYKSELYREKFSNQQYLSQNFENNLQDINLKLRNIQAMELKNYIRNLNLEQSERDILASFDYEIADIFESWRNSQLTNQEKIKTMENNEYFKEYFETVIRQYKISMEKDLDHYRPDFETFLVEKHQMYTSNILHSFENNFRIRKNGNFNLKELQNLLTTLQIRLNSEFVNIKTPHVKKHRNISFWVPWYYNLNYVPNDAVGGDCNTYGPLFVGRISGITVFPFIQLAGWHNGEYSLGRRRFTLMYNDQTYYAFDGPFEILTHKNYRWVHYSQGGQKIEAVDKADGSKFYVCRALVNGCMHPGKLDGRICYVSHEDHLMSLDKNYEILIVNE